VTSNRPPGPKPSPPGSHRPGYKQAHDAAQDEIKEARAQMTKYTVTRNCCTHGHCSLCVGGGNLENCERIVVRKTDDLAVANEYAHVWREYGSKVEETDS